MNFPRTILVFLCSLSVGLGPCQLWFHQAICHHHHHAAQTGHFGEDSAVCQVHVHATNLNTAHAHSCHPVACDDVASDANHGDELEEACSQGSEPFPGVPDQDCHVCVHLAQAPASIEPPVEVAHWVALNIQISVLFESKHVLPAVAPVSLRGPPIAV